MSDNARLGIQAMIEISNLKERSGTIICPKCGGTLVWSKASNDHIRARCETPDCIAFMQ